MIAQETVWQEIWPVVEDLLEATLAGEGERIRALLAPKSEASAIYDLFGESAFEILLKTVLGRARVAVTRAVETGGGRFVHLELVWPDPELTDNSYTAADLVSVKTKRYQKAWRIAAINPAAVDLPLTEARAQGVLVTSKAFSDEQKLPSEPWLLPVALLAGNLQIPLRESAAADAVERLLLPGLQHRTYGVFSLVAGRRLWRDFKRKDKPPLNSPRAWAAATEFVMSEQTAREATQAAVAGHYEVALSQMLPCVKRVKKVLNIQGLDERYSPLGSTQIVLNQNKSD